MSWPTWRSSSSVRSASSREAARVRLRGRERALQLGLDALALGLVALAREKQPVGRAAVLLAQVLGARRALGRRARCAGRPRPRAPARAPV
jgi:hypothetical protein